MLAGRMDHMDVVRTPPERFAALPDFDLDPVFATIDGLSIAHVVAEPDPGTQPTGETVLCMHGEPTWGFLYRKVMAALTAAGHRVVAPDLVGFGRSDKPVERGEYTYQRHVDWMAAWLAKHDLRDLTLLCQDWGGLIGLRLAAEHGERFRRIAAANTGLPVGDGRMTDAFKAWLDFSQNSPEFVIGQIVAGGCATRPPDDVIAAYDAPFPDERYTAGARIFPALVPMTPDDPAVAANRAAWDELGRWDKPFLCAFSDGDPITAGGERILRERVPGAQGIAHVTITGGGHFLQEDRGAELGAAVNQFIAATPQ
jgi:haloalkane dehalogenase